MVLGASALCFWANDPPAPRSGDVPPHQFSEPRARAVVEQLSEGIGVRLNGTPAHRRAAEFLAAELRRIPGLEVEIQEVAGTQVFSTVDFPPFVYRTLNVVARLPGRSTEAVLLDAHFDTQLDSVGAADDAAGVAAILETMRALAREAPLAHSIIVNLNGAEEIGLLGAAGFLKHRWAKDVRVYLYVEALPGGMAQLFGAGPGNAWLAKTYARAVPRPFGSVIGQDLVQAGILPHNGDFTPFHEAGLAGFDVAMTGDGWAYHTMLDRTGRLEPGSLQHLGDSVLALTRALASEPLPADDRSQGSVYYDFLGLVMMAYSMSAARGLELAALVFAAAVIGWAARRRLVSLRGGIAALGWTVLAIVAGLLAAVAAGALVSMGLGRPFGWFSSPGLVVPAFGAPAAAGTIAVHALWRRRARGRRDTQAQLRAALVGALLFWSALLALSAAKGVGAGYLPMFWVLGGVVALLVSMLAPRAPLAVLLACLAPATLLTLEICILFLTYFIPMTGMLGLGPMSDVLIAALVGTTVVSTGALALALLHGTGGFGRAALVLSAVGVLGLALTAGRFPYTEARPKRITISHQADGDSSALHLRSSDEVGMKAILAALPRAPRPDSERSPRAGRFTHEFPAPPPAMPEPRAQVEREEASPDGGRRVTLRIHRASPLLRLGVPTEALLGWSLAPSLEGKRTIGGRYIAQFYDVPEAGEAVTLTLRGTAPVEIELRGTDGARASGPELEALLKALPRWVTPSTYAVRTLRLKI